MYTLTPVTTPAELGAAATEADMAAWNELQEGPATEAYQAYCLLSVYSSSAQTRQGRDYRRRRRISATHGGVGAGVSGKPSGFSGSGSRWRFFRASRLVGRFPRLSVEPRR